VKVYAGGNQPVMQRLSDAFHDGRKLDELN
jgi:hypothetical protein